MTMAVIPDRNTISVTLNKPYISYTQQTVDNHRLSLPGRNLPCSDITHAFSPSNFSRYNKLELLRRFMRGTLNNIKKLNYTTDKSKILIKCERI